jgi:hypothetical protein
MTPLHNRISTASLFAAIAYPLPSRTTYADATAYSPQPSVSGSRKRFSRLAEFIYVANPRAAGGSDRLQGEARGVAIFVTVAKASLAAGT